MNVVSLTKEELRLLLLTCDGVGKDTKEAALDELLNREFNRGYEEGEVKGDT